MEDGEIDDTCENGCSEMQAYRPLKNITFSDDSSDDGSDDNDVTWKRRKTISPALVNKQETKQEVNKKRNNIWGVVLSEQSLSEDIKDFSVKQTLEKTRTVESYDYRTREKLQQQTTSHPDRKRKRIQFTFHYSERESDEEIAVKIAERLKEPKIDLIERTVIEIGRKLGIELLRKTEEIEAGGGMLINNGSRKRTPGGVYLQLLREHSDVSKSQVDNIFKEEKKMTEVHKKKKKRLRRLKSKEDESSDERLPSIMDVVVAESKACEMAVEQAEDD